MEVSAQIVDHNLVENVAAAILREYLHGKGYQKTLQCIDTEMVRTEDSITSRSILAKLLHMEKLLKKNKQHENALKTMLEVLVKYFLCYSKNTKPSTLIKNVPKCKSVRSQRKIQNDCTRRMDSSKPLIDGKRTTSLCDESVKKPQDRNAVKTELNTSSSRAFDISTEPKNYQDETSKQDARLNALAVDFSDEFKNAMKLAQNAASIDHGSMCQKHISRNSPESLTEVKSSSDETKCAFETLAKTHEENLMSGNVQMWPAMDLIKNEFDRQKLSTAVGYELDLGNDENDEIVSADITKHQNATKTIYSQHRIFSGPVSRGGLQSDRGNRLSATRRSFLSSAANYPVKLHMTSQCNEDASIQSADCEATFKKNELQMRKDRAVCGEVNLDGSYEKSVDDNVMGNRVTSELALHSTNSKTNLKIALVSLCGDMEVGDLDELDESNSGVLVSPDHCYAWLTLPQGIPIKYETAIELKTLMLGSYKKDFPLEWKMQSFCRSTNPKLNYGIIQKKGGPCGVLACVQAYVIKELMFAKLQKIPCKGGTTEEDCKKGLVSAIAQILWKIGGSQKAVLLMPTSQIVADLSGLHDGFIERAKLLQFTDLAALQGFLTRNVTWYADDNNYSCISFLYSAILSRGIETVKNDMDDPKSCLIGVHGYCSQEVVNLLLTGCASTNVFDNTITLDDGKETRSILKGVTKRSEIGFLALFEHYNSCQVGDFLKSPQFPIWVVCSESHFSVLFAKDFEACEPPVKNENRINKFDLYYYDGLLHQDDEIRLTISLLNNYSIPQSNDLVPPVDLCIRTKWKNAHVEWNGIEPLL